MKLSGRRIRRIIIASILFILFIFANFYTVRKTLRYGVEVYFYDKMLVAYRVGGIRGLNSEFANTLATDKNSHELAVARNFKKNLKNINSPGSFLEDVVKEKKKKMRLMRNLRDISFGIIIAFLLLRIALDKAENRGK